MATENQNGLKRTGAIVGTLAGSLVIIGTLSGVVWGSAVKSEELSSALKMHEARMVKLEKCAETGIVIDARRDVEIALIGKDIMQIRNDLAKLLKNQEKLMERGHP